jgi:hypothetical protein
VDHHLDSVIDIEALNRRPGSQAFERMLGTLIIAVTDEPPRGFGRKESDNEQRNGPKPLQGGEPSSTINMDRETNLNSKGDTPTPLICPVQQRSEHTR